MAVFKADNFLAAALGIRGWKTVRMLECCEPQARAVASAKHLSAFEHLRGRNIIHAHLPDKIVMLAVGM